MSISKTFDPFTYFPANHPIIFRVSGTNSAEAQYRFIFRLEVGAESQKHKVTPRPTDANGRWDGSAHFRSFLDQDVVNIASVSDFQEAPWVDYEIIMDEEYRDGSGNLVENTGLNTFAGRMAFNAILSRNDILPGVFTLALWRLQNGGTNILMNFENRTTVQKNDLFWVHFTNLVGSIIKFQVIEYDAGGSVLSTTVTSFTPATEKANLAKLDLNDISFNSLTASIGIRFLNSIDSNISKEIILLVVDACTTYTAHKFVYLDKYGSYQSINFDLVSKENNRTNPKTFGKFIDAETETDQSRRLQRFYQDKTKTFTANSEVLEDGDIIRIEDLIDSIRVFLDVRNDDRFPDMNFAPVEILTNSFAPKKSENDELGIYSINWRFAYDEIAQQ